MFRCLRWGERTSLPLEVFRDVFDPPLFAIFAVVEEVGGLSADVLDNSHALMGSVNLQQHMQRIKSRSEALTGRIEKIKSVLPPVMAFKLIPKATCPPCLPWIDKLVRAEGAPEWVHVYYNISMAFTFNLLRYAQLRINQVSLMVANVLSLPAILQRHYLEAVLSLSTEICSTVVYFISGGQKTLVQMQEVNDVRGFRIYVVLRYMVAAHMGLETATHYGMDTRALSSWLDRVSRGLRQHFGMRVPFGKDPLRPVGRLWEPDGRDDLVMPFMCSSIAEWA
jgi:hypothetical protein